MHDDDAQTLLDRAPAVNSGKRVADLRDVYRLRRRRDVNGIRVWQDAPDENTRFSIRTCSRSSRRLDARLVDQRSLCARCGRCHSDALESRRHRRLGRPHGRRTRASSLRHAFGPRAGCRHQRWHAGRDDPRHQRRARRRDRCQIGQGLHEQRARGQRDGIRSQIVEDRARHPGFRTQSRRDRVRCGDETDLDFQRTQQRRDGDRHDHRPCRRNGSARRQARVRGGRRARAHFRQ